MTSIDFGLGPPPTPVDGRYAVAIHFDRVSAHVRLDCATHRASVDAAVAYTVGPNAGHPLFDLRQRVSACLLDGAPLPVGRIGTHDMRQGPGSTIRILDRWQEARSMHTLRFRYLLQLPASPPGGYRPALDWLSGPAVRWTLGMSDLSPGRYLESWFPANLPFDQFPFDLQVQIAGSAVEHRLITNGMVTEQGRHRWRIAFPERFTAMAHLLEIDHRDALLLRCAEMRLPVSGQTVRLRVGKHRDVTADLDSQLPRLARLLAHCEREFGTFAGDEYVALFHGGHGGMEYNQGCTTSVAALPHEVLHSWFARSVTPSAPTHGWWDEGFTTFYCAGARPEPFDFRADPVTLCTRQPFRRVTPAAAYTDGARFFRGVAAMIGTRRLLKAMRSLYETRCATPLSTAQLRDHLIEATGECGLVGAFDRFVYGIPGAEQRTASYPVAATTGDG